MHSSDGEPWTFCCSFIFAIFTFGEPTRVESSSLSDFSVSSLLSLPVDVFSSSSSPSSRSCNHSNQVSYTRKEPLQYSVTNSCVITIFLSKSHLRPSLDIQISWAVLLQLKTHRIKRTNSLHQLSLFTGCTVQTFPITSIVFTFSVYFPKCLHWNVCKFNFLWIIT